MCSMVGYGEWLGGFLFDLRAFHLLIVLKNQVKNGLCSFCKEMIPGLWSMS